ncbi:MAG: ABC transporter permease [Treponema sp.]|jgi:putative ABC transport system permease protein|nr:ABC transporter permease [Treponema sp.]
MNDTRYRRGGAGFLIKIACRNIRRNMRRTALCVAAVGVAVFFIIVIQSLMGGMTGGIEKVVRVFDTGHISAVSADYEAEKEYMPVQYPVGNGRAYSGLAAEIKAIPGVKAVFPRISAYATLQDSTVKHAMLWGIDVEGETAVNNFNMTTRGDGLLEGRYPAADSNECAIGSVLAAKTGLRPGDRIPLKTVSAQFSDKMWNPVITGVFEFDYMKFDDSVILVDFGRLRRLLVLGDAAQQIFVFAEKETRSRAIAAEMKLLLGEGDVVRDWQDNYFVALMRQSMAVFYLVEAVFLIVASFLIVNTMVMIVHERIKEIGMMGSLGMTRSEIVRVFFFESVFLSVLGSLAGVIPGGVLTFAGSLFPLDFNALTGGGFKEFPASGALFLEFGPGVLAMGFFSGVIIASICTLFPSLKSAFVEPVEALRR